MLYIFTHNTISIGYAIHPSHWSTSVIHFPTHEQLFTGCVRDSIFVHTPLMSSLFPIILNNPNDSICIGHIRSYLFISPYLTLTKFIPPFYRTSSAINNTSYKYQSIYTVAPFPLPISNFVQVSLTILRRSHHLPYASSITTFLPTHLSISIFIYILYPLSPFHTWTIYYTNIYIYIYIYTLLLWLSTHNIFLLYAYISLLFV